LENIHLESEDDVSKAALLRIIRTEVLRIGSDHAQRWALILAVLKYWGCDIRVNYSKTLHTDKDT
jgi:hypothetical protein